MKEENLLIFMEEIILIMRTDCRNKNINLEQIHDILNIIHNIPFHDSNKMPTEMGRIESEIKRFDKKYGKIFIQGKLWKIYQDSKK